MSEAMGVCEIAEVLGDTGLDVPRDQAKLLEWHARRLPALHRLRHTYKERSPPQPSKEDELPPELKEGLLAFLKQQTQPR